jgi:DNA polymerase-3 subunit delta'
MSLSDFSKYGGAAEKLSAAIGSGRTSHAYIFEGDNNVDKMGFAKAFAKALLCRELPGEGCDRCPTCRKIDDDNYEDLYLVLPVWNEGKTRLAVRDENVVEMQSNLKTRPTGGERNIAIIEGGDTMSPTAQNRLLKTLEEPNPGTVIMILSENPEYLLPTINSRCINCRLIDFEAGPTNKMVELARSIIDMAVQRQFFFDIKKTLDGKLKNRKDGLAFLDGMETVLGEYMRNNSELFTKDKLIMAIDSVEAARSNILRNISYKYSIRDLILKLEE